MSDVIRVVVVDDEQLAREELCYQLEQLGDIEVIAQAADGVEALATVEKFTPDLVFLDVQMPGLNGFEVARRLLEDEDPPAVVFVKPRGEAPSAYQTVSDVIHCLAVRI